MINREDLNELILAMCSKELNNYQTNMELPEDFEADRFNSDILDDYDLEEILYDAFEMDIEQFEELVRRLLPLIYVSESLFDKKLVKGFAKDNTWLVKTEC